MGLGKAWEKSVPKWVRKSESKVIQAFLDGAIAGDGWVQNGAASYATTSRVLANGVQELFIKLGKAASVRHVDNRTGGMILGKSIEGRRPQWWVREWTKDRGGLRNKDNEPNFEVVPYAGMVYCATVPNGTLVVRRNGKPMIAGNCLRYIELSGLAIARTKREAKSESLWADLDAGQADQVAGY